MQPSPYEQMRAWLLPIVLAGGCDAEVKTTASTACLEVPLGTEECPAAADIYHANLTGGCGSIIASIDGEGTFGTDPAGRDDTSVWCCYPVHETEPTCTYGRPYASPLDPSGLVSPLLATIETGRGWCPAPHPSASIPEQAREALQIAWEAAALDEHAAVAAFSRVALELLAFGAPADLVDATLAAAREEVVHAKLGFALASRYAGTPRSPGPFPSSRRSPARRTWRASRRRPPARAASARR